MDAQERRGSKMDGRVVYGENVGRLNGDVSSAWRGTDRERKVRRHCSARQLDAS